jgi:hypothetical protein
LYNKIQLELMGIPPHAWNLTTVRKFLAPFCWVERLHDATMHKDDLKELVLTAWTEHPFAIPPSRKLRIAEWEIPTVHFDPDLQRISSNLPPYLRQKRTLIYNVSIHLRSIADFQPRTPSTSSSSMSDDGDSGPDDNPDRHYGLRQGHAGPRFSGFPRRDANAPDRPGKGRRAPAGNDWPTTDVRSITSRPDPPHDRPPAGSNNRDKTNHPCKGTPVELRIVGENGATGFPLHGEMQPAVKEVSTGRKGCLEHDRAADNPSTLLSCTVFIGP